MNDFNIYKAYVNANKLLDHAEDAIDEYKIKPEKNKLKRFWRKTSVMWQQNSLTYVRPQKDITTV